MPIKITLWVKKGIHEMLKGRHKRKGGQKPKRKSYAVVMARWKRVTQKQRQSFFI